MRAGKRKRRALFYTKFGLISLRNLMQIEPKAEAIQRFRIRGFRSKVRKRYASRGAQETAIVLQSNCTVSL